MTDIARVTCGMCARCRQCFEQDVDIGYKPYTKEAYEEFQNFTACNDWFKDDYPERQNYAANC